MRRLLTSLLGLAAAGLAAAQEARFGVAVPGTFAFKTSQTHRPKAANAAAAAWTPALRANLYPTLKLGSRWFAYGAVQVHTAGYFGEELWSTSRRPRIALLQGYIGYSRVGHGRAITVKAGQLTSAFGSFPLRYDEMRNWLIDLPQAYGYYYFPVTVYGMPGAEVDFTLGHVDGRVQFTNSSPSNPRKLWQPDQYANWTFGGGVTIRQGLRLGVSAVHGPYLHRQHGFFFPREARPRELPATGYGADLQWGRGLWNVNAEWQRFQYPYRAIPYFFNTLGYGEAKLTLTPRWYFAGRLGARWRSAGLRSDRSYEAVLGLRLAENQLLKVGYLALDGPFSVRTRDNVFSIQYVVSMNPPAIALR